MAYTPPGTGRNVTRTGYQPNAWSRPQSDSPVSGLDNNQRNAYVAIQNMLKQFGLESLAPKILSYVKQGYSSDTISVQLQETKEWKQRFAANEVRVKKGLPVLSPQEYIATERAYRQIMQNAGVPSGFYDSTKDFQSFLEKDISPEEVNNRVKAATDFVQRADPKEVARMKQWYTTGDMIAFALDPKRAQPLVGKAFQAATIAGQADQQGVRGLDKRTAESLAGEGVSREQAQQGFGLIAGEQDNANRLASIYGQGKFSTGDLVDEVFRADASVAERRRRLASQERGSFSGSGGAGRGSLAKNSGGV